MLKLTYNDLCRYPGFRFHVEYSVFPDHACQLHTHEFAELVVVRHGRGRHVIGRNEYQLEAGDVFVVRPEDVHGYEDMEGLDLINVIFDPEQFLIAHHDLHHIPGFHMLFHLEPLFRHDYRFSSRLGLTADAMRHVYDLVDPMEQEYVVGRPGFECAIHSYFRLLVVFLSRRYAEQQIPSSQELLRLSQVQSYIQSHYGEEIDLDQLADMASMSKNSLLRAFRRCYESTPISYLIRVRLAKACELLADDRLSITDVAHTVGFSDHSHFTRTFQRTFGKSPRDYRSTFEFQGRRPSGSAFS